MNGAQCQRYIMEASLAFVKGPGAEMKCKPAARAAFKQFRDDEKLYAIGRPTDFKNFTQMDLTRCLIHFRALQYGERLTFDEITELATARQEAGLLESFRAQWDAVNPAVRGKILRQRHNILFFEELATLDPVDARFVRITLNRLAKEYPREGEAPAEPLAAPRKDPVCTTP